MRAPPSSSAMQLCVKPSTIFTRPPDDQAPGAALRFTMWTTSTKLIAAMTHSTADSEPQRDPVSSSRLVYSMRIGRMPKQWTIARLSPLVQEDALVGVQHPLRPQDHLWSRWKTFRSNNKWIQAQEDPKDLRRQPLEFLDHQRHVDLHPVISSSSLTSLLAPMAGRCSGPPRASCGAACHPSFAWGPPTSPLEFHPSLGLFPVFHHSRPQIRRPRCSSQVLQ